MFVLGLLALAGQATAACVADGPLETARWIRAHQSGFAIYQAPQDKGAMERMLSPRLLDLLKVEWQCQVIEEGLCGVDANPWTNALEGDVQGAVTFELVSQVRARSTVIMRFHFGRAGADPEKLAAAWARLELLKDARSGCWQLDDLVGRKGQSLAKKLESYRFY